NYTISYQPGTLTVAQRSITVAANAQSMTYGDPVPELTYTVGGSGLVTGDSLFGALATSATSASNVGAYGIMQGSLRNSNYRITYTAGTLIVSPLSTVAPRPRPLSVNTTSHEVLEPILIPSQLTPQAVVYDNPAVNPSSGKFIMTAETCSGAQMGQAQSSSGLAITCTGN
ncbi:MBG domain-containing protein, partial [Rhizobium lusitanum]